MSIEYTIDLQLTELGFPDILLPDKSCDNNPEQQRGDANVPAGGGTSHVPTGHPENQEGPPGPSEESDAGAGPESDSESSDASDAQDPSESSCQVCGLQLPSKSKLLDHINAQHSTLRCSKCGRRFSDAHSYHLHLNTHTKPTKFFCRICQVSFKSLKDLRQHLAATHLENEFFECDNCKHVFTSLQACQRHVELRSCVVDLRCRVCGQCFTSRGTYQRHRRTTCIFTHQCKVCPKKFSRKNSLLRHSFSHLGALPYTCMLCHTRFKKANLYHAHKCKTQLVNCRVCLREFENALDFQQHIRDTGCWGNQEPKENVIRCLECGQRFESTDELKKHSSAHQKVLKCAECGKGFRSALLLMSHMGGHAGVSPCLCQTCGLGFPHLQNYDSHLKTCGKEPKILSKPKKPLVSSKSKPGRVSVDPGRLMDSDTKTDTSEGWKLTLDKDPPLGASLVLILPSSATVSEEPGEAPTHDPRSSKDQQTPRASPNSSGNVSSDVSMPSVKSEPEESEISGSPASSLPASDIKTEPVDVEMS